MRQPSSPARHTDFRALFAGSPAPMLVLAPDAPRFTITDVNDAYLAAVMRTGDDLIGLGVFEAMPDNPADPGATGVTNLRASIERAIAGKGPDRMPVQKYDIPRPGGGFEERWWDPVNAPVLDERGEVVAVVHQVTDASARVRAEAEAEAHAARQDFRLALEERLRDLAEPAAIMDAATALLGGHLGVAQVGFAEVEDDQEHIVVARDWNEGSVPSVVGRWRMDDFGPAFVREMKSGETIVIPDVSLDARTRAPEVVAAYEGIGTRAVLDLPLVKHGRLVAVLFIHHPEPRAWAPGEVALVEETCERLWSAVERARAEERLRELNETLERQVAERTAALSESQRRFQGIFDSAFQFMALLAPDGTVVEVNRTALAWSQITSADIVGHPFWLAAPMRGNAALQAAIEAGVRRAAAGETVRQEHEMRGAGEVRATVDFSLKPVFGERNDIVWLVAEGRDITPLKEAQEALRQSQKLESMGQLTGGVAHDINNLLTPITGVLDLLQSRGVGGERERRLIDGALQSAERAKLLVQRLLAFARRQPLQATAVDVARVVESIAELVGSTAGPQIKLVVDLAPDLPPACADANQLELALLNLSVNARDAMPDGGTLRISAQGEEVRMGHRIDLPPGRYVRLSVADTGTGMSEATLQRAVEPFFSTKGVGKGTGLGLSMVHGLAGQLGGRMIIKSEPGIGTNVELWLPVARREAETSEPKTKAELEIAAGTVLLVDDEELVRVSTADMLGELGYAIVEAASAEEALRLLDEGLVPDLVVTDHLMSGMTGTELARKVRQRLPSTRALIVSGYAEVEGVAPDLPRLEKPFRRSDLATSLAELAETGS